MVFVMHCYSIVPVWTVEEIYTFIWKKGVRFILHFYAGRECMYVDSLFGKSILNELVGKADMVENIYSL